MLKLKQQRTKRDVIGFRLPMARHEEDTLDVSDILVIDPDNTFYMKMGSDVMAGYHILKDHVLVVDRSLAPVEGSVVVFAYQGEFYTRVYQPANGQIILAASEKGESLTIDLAEGWTCFGVVTASLNPLLQPKHKVGRYAGVCSC